MTILQYEIVIVNEKTNNKVFFLGVCMCVCVFDEVVGILEGLEEQTTSSSLLNADRRAKCDGVAANILPPASVPHWEVD